MPTKHTVLNLLIIIACGVLPWLLLAMLSIDGSFSRLLLFILTTSVPALAGGLLLQSIANIRGRSKRTPLQGTAFYGAYIAVILGALRIGIVLVVALSRV